MKFANGTGSITKLKGNRRKPYWVRSPEVRYVEDGKIKRKRNTIGYAATQKEALKLLTDYMDNPYSFNKVTVEDLWKRAANMHYFSDNRKDTLNAIFNKYLDPIRFENIQDIKIDHLQSIIDNTNTGSATKDSIKAVMHYIYKYALVNEYVSQDLSQHINYKRDKVKIDRVVFTDQEVQKLWALSDSWYVAYTLILLYTGCRFSEIADNKAVNIDLENKTIYIPEEISKNDSSNRTIPIHDKIIPLIKRNLGSEWAFSNEGNKVDYGNYTRRYLSKINAYLGTTHKMHDTRHTFTTKMRKVSDVLYVDELLGHTHGNITDDVYNHIDIKDLATEINKLSYDL